MKLDQKKAAFLTLDYQKGILGNLPDGESVVSVAAKAISITSGPTPKGVLKNLLHGLWDADHFRSMLIYVRKSGARARNI